MDEAVKVFPVHPRFLCDFVCCRDIRNSELLAEINCFGGLMEVRIWATRAIDHVLPWQSFIWGNCQHQSDGVNECREERAGLVYAK